MIFPNWLGECSGTIEVPVIVPGTSCEDIPALRNTSRSYTTRRVAITNAIVGSLQRINGVYPFSSDLEGRIFSKGGFADSIEDYPTLHVKAGYETRSYLGAGYKDRYLTLTVRCFLHDEDSSSLGLLMEEVETVLDSSSNIRYYDSEGTVQRTKKITILSLNSEEVNSPYLYGEITCEVMY